MTTERLYDCELTIRERDFVDECFQLIVAKAKTNRIPLFGDDRMEHAVDALAKLVFLSREEKE